jgi:hypothetical protein
LPCHDRGDRANGSPEQHPATRDRHGRSDFRKDNFHGVHGFVDDSSRIVDGFFRGITRGGVCPTGSIAVATAFAAGTNMQDVFIDPAQITASMTLLASS